MTWAEAMVMCRERLWDEERARPSSLLRATIAELRDFAAAQRASANALDVLISFQLEGVK